MPKPRNDSVLSTRIASATTSVAFTMIGPKQFGSTCRTMMRVFDAPIVRAASTNSRSRSDKRRAAHDARDRSPEQERQQQRDAERAAQVERSERAEIDGADRHRHREDRQRGKRDPEVGEAHEQVVEPAAVEAGERADHHADDRRQDRDPERDPQRDLPTVEHARERVAAQLVGAEPVRATTGPAGGSRRCCSVGLGAKLRADEAGEHHEHEEAERDQRQLVPAELPHRAAPLTAAAGAGRLRSRGGRVDRLGTRPRRLVAHPHAHAGAHLARRDAPAHGGSAGRARRRGCRRARLNSTTKIVATAIHASSTG